MGLLYSNYENKQETNFKINQVSGMLAKTLKKSYFVNFQKGSPMEHFYFREDKPSRILEKRGTYHNQMRESEKRHNGFFYRLKEIIVLQVMLMSEDNYLVEAIDKVDYEKYFENDRREYKDN